MIEIFERFTNRNIVHNFYKSYCDYIEQYFVISEEINTNDFDDYIKKTLKTFEIIPCILLEFEEKQNEE